ncbi:interleukin-1 family member A [Osmerus eperlanus]|uniref:interleukin-1 family member A n=1 Tax=Osmerus eperlanus TaxID=29151 RepID=UPI002E0F0B1F
METKDFAQSVQGGVSISHTLQDGKHCYEVESVLKTRGGGVGAFARKGDKILTMNGVSLQDITPEGFADMLIEEAPILTVHQGHPNSDTGCPTLTCPDRGSLCPFFKESTLLSFSLEMKREEDLEEEEEKEEGPGICPGTDDAKKPQGGGASDEREGVDMVLVAMTNTTISVVRGRGCDSGSPCHDCGGTGCTFNDVVVVAGSSNVTLVARGGESFKKLERDRKNICIEHLNTHFYLRKSCPKSSPYMSPNPEKMTIYYYASDSVDGTFKGMPVALNFTDSNCYLKCSKESDRVSLCIETCDKKELKMIPPGDQDALGFLFYMKAASVRSLLKFESVAFPGWFIHTNSRSGELAPSAQVKQMEKGQEKEALFFFLIKNN